ncbi:hypothetical protein ACMGD3_06120 [Lysinibacillus sphaericus]|uniref:hypothetical protein n=1 Tax=Lysinibacillus sphaericus TaxID=1421 RepID=UPI003F7A8ACD
MAKKGKGFFGSIGSFLGSIPAVGKVKNAAKSVKKKIKNTKKKLKKAIKKAKKKLKKKLKKKIGKVFTKARKLKNNLSKSKMVKKFKRTAKKVVLAAKQAAKKTYTKVKQAVKEVKAKVKETVVPLKPSKGKVEKISKKVGNKIQGEAELAKFFDEYLKDRKTVGSIGNKYSVQDGNPLITLQDKRQVLSAPSTADPDGLAPYAVIGYKMFVEDFVTLANPNATLQERNEATLSALSPFGKAGKGKKVAEALKDMEKGLEAAQDFNKYANKGKDAQKATQKEKEQLGEYVNKGTDKGGTPKGFEKQAKSANDISKKANEGKIKYASNYHGRLGKEKELEILSNPDSVYVAGNNSQNLIYMKGGNVVIVESKGSSKGNTITSYGPDGARGESGAAIFGGKPTDPGKPVTHDAIVNGNIPTPSGGTMPPATQLLP